MRRLRDTYANQAKEDELTKAATIHDKLTKTAEYDEAKRDEYMSHMTQEEKEIELEKRMEEERLKREQNLVLDKLSVELVLFEKLRRKDLKKLKNKREVTKLVRYQTITLSIPEIPQIIDDIKEQNENKDAITNTLADNIVENFDLSGYDIEGLKNNVIRKTDTVDRLRYFILFLIKYQLKLKNNRDYRVLANMKEHLEIDHIDKNDIFLVFSQYILSDMKKKLRDCAIQNGSSIRVILKQNVSNLGNNQIVNIHKIDKFFYNVCLVFVFVFIYLFIMFVCLCLYVIESKRP